VSALISDGNTGVPASSARLLDGEEQTHPWESAGQSPTATHPMENSDLGQESRFPDPCLMVSQPRGQPVSSSQTDQACWPSGEAARTCGTTNRSNRSGQASLDEVVTMTVR
jgi:hypothetical protein